jgi:hypothetical protein
MRGESSSIYGCQGAASSMARGGESLTKLPSHHPLPSPSYAVSRGCRRWRGRLSPGASRSWCCWRGSSQRRLVNGGDTWWGCFSQRCGVALAVSWGRLSSSSFKCSDGGVLSVEDDWTEGGSMWSFLRATNHGIPSLASSQEACGVTPQNFKTKKSQFPYFQNLEPTNFLNCITLCA